MEIKKIHTQRALSPTNISLADYVINPYRGCEFGCLYCYAQENKNIGEGNLAKALAVKINIADILKKELRVKKPRRVLLGSTTECFQPVEKEFHLTEQVMQILNGKKIPFTILTKSDAIGGYSSIISANQNNAVYFTVNFADEATIRIIEERSSPLSARLDAIRKLLEHKINVRLHIGPFVPFLSDLKSLLKMAPIGIKEINIELYHHKMGNFAKILKFSPQLADIYASKESYDNFCARLKDEIKGFTSKYDFKFFFIAPDFEKFYQSSIDYETPLF